MDSWGTYGIQLSSIIDHWFTAQGSRRSLIVQGYFVPTQGHVRERVYERRGPFNETVVGVLMGTLAHLIVPPGDFAPKVSVRLLGRPQHQVPRNDLRWLSWFGDEAIEQPSDGSMQAYANAVFAVRGSSYHFRGMDLPTDLPCEIARIEDPDARLTAIDAFTAHVRG
jgi:hypothetical protein